MLRLVLQRRGVLLAEISSFVTFHLLKNSHKRKAHAKRPGQRLSPVLFELHSLSRKSQTSKFLPLFGLCRQRAPSPCPNRPNPAQFPSRAFSRGAGGFASTPRSTAPPGHRTAPVRVQRPPRGFPNRALPGESSGRCERTSSRSAPCPALTCWQRAPPRSRRGSAPCSRLPSRTWRRRCPRSCRR